MSGGEPNHQNHALLRLAAAKGVGPRTMARVRAAGLDGAQLVSMEPQEIAGALTCTAAMAHALVRALRAVDAHAVADACARTGTELLDPRHPSWPVLVEALPDPPAFLWVRGRNEVLSHPGVAIVGSRRCSLAGRLQAESFARHLGGGGYTIISGGARGIDGSAHRGALQAAAPTIAVLGCAADVVYPPEHARLYAEMIESGGALVSEWPPGMPPRPGHFPRRNRIIAAMAIGTLVVEARERSGALVTARLTIEELGRECWALPARCDDAHARGSLLLLQRGEAAMVLAPQDMEGTLRSRMPTLHPDWRPVKAMRSDHGGAPSSERTPAERVIAEALRDHDACDQERLVALTQLPAHEVQTALILMELRGQIARDVGGEIRLRP